MIAQSAWWRRRNSCQTSQPLRENLGHGRAAGTGNQAEEAREAPKPAKKAKAATANKAQQAIKAAARPAAERSKKTAEVIAMMKKAKGAMLAEIRKRPADRALIRRRDWSPGNLERAAARR